MKDEINKEWVITLILCFFLGCLWVHRFYNWKIWTWILMLVTFWWLWIWAFVDFIIVAMWNFKHKDGTIITMKIKVKDDLLTKEL